MAFRTYLLLISFFLYLYAPSSYARIALPPSTYVVDSAAASTTQEPEGDKQVTSEEMTSSYESAFFKMMITLVGLLLFVGLTIWVLRRIGKLTFKGAGAGRSIQIIEKRALSPKSVLYVVEIDNKKILIAESQLEIRHLATLDEPNNLK